MLGTLLRFVLCDNMASRLGLCEIDARVLREYVMISSNNAT